MENTSSDKKYIKDGLKLRELIFSGNIDQAKDFLKSLNKTDLKNALKKADTRNGKPFHSMLQKLIIADQITSIKNLHPIFDSFKWSYSLFFQSIYVSIVYNKKEAFDFLMHLVKPEKEGEATMNSLLEYSARSGEIYFVERIFDLGKSNNLKFDINFAISMARTMEIANFFVQKGGDLSAIGKPLKLKLISADSSALEKCEYPYRRRPSKIEIVDFCKKYQISKENIGRLSANTIGKSNPQIVDNKCYQGLFRNRIFLQDIYRHFEFSNDWEKVLCAGEWSHNRFGQSTNILPDGRIIEIGGEDLNTVNAYSPIDKIHVFAYPLEIFPYSHYHSATTVDDKIIIIGGLGRSYDKKIVDAIDEYSPTEVSMFKTNRSFVYSLDLNTYEIKEVKTTGDKPKLLCQHDTQYLVDEKCIEVKGGQYSKDGFRFYSNLLTYRFNLQTLSWDTISREPDKSPMEMMVWTGQQTLNLPQETMFF